ncbi:nuclease-related domain-containing protein [Neobacillus sp. D3-1R]|uniref:nuclease-related domain-containing protein n=1 Tax=Neobacillus sp. D3-1R TaxID=3445778 RepID=UPI003FA16A69
MNILEREIPKIIPKLEALSGRLSPFHEKQGILKLAHSRFLAGYQGEKAVDYYFSLMDQDKYDFYHGIRLFNGKTYFQIDTLIISNAFILPIEIKNLAGTIEYDRKNNKFTNSGGVITNPLSQVKLQKLQLTDWLQNKNCPPIPDFLVAMSNPSTKINSPSGLPDQYWKICSGQDLLEKIQIYEKMYKTEHISLKERKRLRKLLLKAHTPLNPDVLKKYKISKEELIPGVQCPSCNAIPMDHIYGKWECPKCLTKSKTAHIKTIQDHFLLNGPTITNKQFREFTLLKDRQVATRILISLKLPYIGTNKGRVYYSPEYNPNQD